ncbi:hypothetical protein M758_1G190900 [Ceratodon purpureus]|nr:hypothetical protein M758_1G190900 [Ceratodon purpureus]
MAESQGASADSKPRGADMTAPPLRAHHVASVPVAGPEICLIEKTEFNDSTSADAADLVTEVDLAKAAALEENQVLNEDQALKDVNQIMIEREDEVAQNVIVGVTRRSEDFNRDELPGYKNSRASLGDFFPRLDGGDANYQSLLEENKLLQKRNKDLEEENRGLNEQVRIQAGVITGLTCFRH